MSTIITSTNNMTNVGLDNCYIAQSRGNDTYAVINHNSGALAVTNSVVVNRAQSSTYCAPAINVRIPTGDAPQEYYLLLNNTYFYAETPQTKDVVKDVSSNTGTLNMFINSNCSTNMNLPSITHSGVLVKKGPGILGLTDLPLPLW